MRNLNIRSNTNITKTIDIFSYNNKHEKCLLYKIFILILMCSSAIKATNPDPGRDSNNQSKYNIENQCAINTYFLSWPENISISYEFNIFLTEKNKNKKNDSDNLLLILQKLIDNLNDPFKDIKNSKMQNLYNTIKIFLEKFKTSLSKLKKYSDEQNNDKEKKFPNQEIYLEQYNIFFVVKPVYIGIYNSCKYFYPIMDAIVKMEEFEEKFKNWLVEIHSYSDSQENDITVELLYDSLLLFVDESFKVLLVIFESNVDDTSLFNQNLDVFWSERISFLIKEIEEQKPKDYKISLIDQKKDFIVNIYEKKFLWMIGNSFLDKKHSKNKSDINKIINEFLKKIFEKYKERLREVNQNIDDNNEYPEKYKGETFNIKKITEDFMENFINENFEKEDVEIIMDYTDLDKKKQNEDISKSNSEKDKTKIFIPYFNKYLVDLYVLNIYLLKEIGDKNVLIGLFDDIHKKFIKIIDNFYKIESND